MPTERREERSSAEVLLSSSILSWLCSRNRELWSWNSPFRMRPLLLSFCMSSISHHYSRLSHLVVQVRWYDKKKKKALLVWAVINCSFKILSTEFSYVKLKCWIIMQFISAYNWKFVQYWYCVYMNKSFRSWFDDMKPYDDMMIWFDDGVMIWFDMNKSFR